MDVRDKRGHDAENDSVSPGNALVGLINFRHWLQETVEGGSVAEKGAYARSDLVTRMSKERGRLLAGNERSLEHDPEKLQTFRTDYAPESMNESTMRFFPVALCSSVF